MKDITLKVTQYSTQVSIGIFANEISSTKQLTYKAMNASGKK